MFPRYGRSNRKYKVKAPKSKISFERKLFLQSVISCGILIAGITVSFFSFCPKKTFAEILYTTYNLTQWQDSIKPATAAIKKSSRKLAAMYTDRLAYIERSLGIKSEPENGVTAKAQKQEEEPAKKPEEAPVPAAEAEEAPAPEPPQWQIPLSGEITSAFGSRIHPINGQESTHTGVDIAAPEGKTIVAAFPGTVTNTGYDDANGHYIVVEHEGGITTVYAHLLSVSVVKGETVSPRIKIGEVGSTGISTGPHLHFEIKKDGKSVNPEEYVSFE